MVWRGWSSWVVDMTGLYHGDPEALTGGAGAPGDVKYPAQPSESPFKPFWVAVV